MIPDWNISAVLPPVRPGAGGGSPDRSPYVATLSQVVERFAFSQDRIEILRGLVAYRAELRNRGVAAGFQWLDGSFMEHKELLQGVSPNDVDVVTFFTLPDSMDEPSFIAANGDLFDPDTTKGQYRVDAYPFLLGRQMTQADIRQVSYWYSMWSHRRNSLWKGFVQVDMAQEEDVLASALLDQIALEGVAR